MELEIVDESEKRAPALRVKILTGVGDDLRARELGDGQANRAPRLLRRYRKGKRGDLVRLVRRVA